MFLVLRFLHWFRDTLHCSPFLSTSVRGVPPVPLAAVNRTAFLPWHAHPFTAVHTGAGTSRTYWLQDLGRAKFGSQVVWLLHCVGERRGSWSTVARGAQRTWWVEATLPEPSWHPDLQGHVQGLFKTLFLARQKEIPLFGMKSGFPDLSLSVASTDFFFNCIFPILQTFDTFDMQVGDHLGLAWQRGRQVKTPLTFVFSSGYTSVSEIWFSFLVQAGPVRLGMCYILTTPRPSQAEAELKQIWAGLQAAQLGQMWKLNIMNSIWWLLGTVS